MVQSMTAFARVEEQGEWGEVSIELRSVNHRFLEVSFRLPEELRPLEPGLRERIGGVLKRGKVDCAIRYRHPEAEAGELELNRELAGSIAHLSREVDGLLYNAAPVSSLDVLRWPGVLQAKAPDVSQLHGAALALLDRALAELSDSRQREGSALRALIEQRCDAITAVVSDVRQRLPQVLEAYRDRLRTRLEEVKVELDPARLEQEIVLFAQKMDVDEELDRLETHVAEVRRVLDRDEPIGRRLDFLMQELNREANTLASKSADTAVTGAAVDLKVLVEQMREQIQNIE